MYNLCSIEAHTIKHRVTWGNMDPLSIKLLISSILTVLTETMLLLFNRQTNDIN